VLAAIGHQWEFIWPPTLRRRMRGRATLGYVDEEKVMTAAELEQLPLGERHRIAAEAIVTDLSQVPPEFLDRARQRGRELLEERGVVLPPST
jgi:hypothetical protein